MVNIRTMLRSDRADVSRLIFESTNSWYQQHFAVTPFSDPQQTIVFFDLYQTLDPGHGFVAEVDGVLAGSCFYHPRDTHMSLGIMNAHPKFFGQGVARTLLARIVQEADRRSLPLRLVSSAMNLDSFSLYNRAGFVPRMVFNDLLLKVPAEGLSQKTASAERVKEITLRPATPQDAVAMADFEYVHIGIRRQNDIAHFISNSEGFWHTMIAERDGALTGWLVSCTHPANSMIGPGAITDDSSAYALIAHHLSYFCGRNVMVMIPAQHHTLVQKMYALGARNCELHFAQCRGRWANPTGIMIPTFLPETA